MQSAPNKVQYRVIALLCQKHNIVRFFHTNKIARTELDGITENAHKPSRGYWHNENFQRDAIERIGRKLGVKELDDWYTIKSTNVHRELSFLNKYKSLYSALKTLYPQHNWDPLRFSRIPHGYWMSESAQREALEKFGREKFGVKELDDWYSVKTREVKNQFSFIRDFYGGSLFNALKKLYPTHNWNFLRMEESAQREALERLGRDKLGVKELDDWYSISLTTVHRELSAFNKKYGSLYNALKALYPQHNWDPLRFSRLTRIDENTQRDALEKLGREKLGVKELDDWYSVKASDVHRELSFLHQKHGSLYNALKTLYPQHNWDPIRFTKVPQGYWDAESTHRTALERIGSKKLGVKELDDWYHVSAMDVHKEITFLSKYGTLFDALKTLYPQHNWNPLRFSRTPHGYWTQNVTIEYYYNLFNKWKREHNIRTVRDWYELPPEQVDLFNRASMGIFKSKRKMLEEWFPDIVWHSQHTSQLELQSLLRHVIADASIKHRFMSKLNQDLNKEQTAEDEHQDTFYLVKPTENQWKITLSQVLVNCAVFQIQSNSKSVLSLESLM